MGMICVCRRISPGQLQQVLDKPEAVEELFFGEEVREDPTYLDIDKAWHGIHFLLNGDPWKGEGPLFNAVLGGTEFGDNISYGPARYLTPAQVRETAEALRRIDDAELRTRYSFQELDDAFIYPTVWVRDGDEGMDYTMHYFVRLREFFLAAAENGQAVITCIL